MIDYVSVEDKAILNAHGLDDFDALWALQRDAVDQPNRDRGGCSTVVRLDLGEVAYYLKRQSNHLTRSLLHPLGEPTFTREFRNILRYQRLGIPTLQVGFFGERKVHGEKRAVLLTRALDSWSDLDTWLRDWPSLLPEKQQAILQACGGLARCLHAAGQRHGCFYPKHIFLKEHENGFEACLIDLEKTRPLRLGKRERIKDIEPLLRRVSVWSERDVRELFASYLDSPSEAMVADWIKHVGGRRQYKNGARA